MKFSIITYLHIEIQTYLSEMIFSRYIKKSIRSYSLNFWSYIHSKRTTSRIPGKMEYEGKVVSCPQIIVNAFGLFFQSVYLPNNDDAKIAEPIANMQNNGSINIDCVTEMEIQNAITKLKNKMTSGLDLIPSFLVKNYSNVLIKPLLIIFNLALITSTVVAVFFDLEKAYDMTWRYGVIQTIYNWGLKGNLARFICSFLANRKFRVRIGNTFSDTYTLENGIPQGSTLSVTLFAIAVNKLLEDIDPRVGRSLYVDDLAIFYADKNMEEVEQTIQRTINKIVDKADSRGFRFSITKTHCVHFCRLRTPHNKLNN